MCNDLLPESVNVILDDFETGLCLPILLMMILCTLQFILNHILDIACTVGTAMTATTNPIEEPFPDDIKVPGSERNLPQQLRGFSSFNFPVTFDLLSSITNLD